MEENTITLTQEELQTKIDEAISVATQDLVKKHNTEMYNARKEIKELKNANLSQEEIEQRVRQEQDEDIKRELAELRSYKKQSVLGEKLAKEGLPAYFKNDSRLLNAEDGDLDKAIKVVKKEYEDSLPKGSQHSTIVNTNVKQPQISDKDKANAEFGQALKELVGR